MDDLIPNNIQCWNEKTIENIIEYKPEESDSFDLKEKLDFGNKKYKQKIVNIITSFANLSGGFIIFGISDKFEPIGIKLENRFEINLLFSQALELVQPHIQFETKKIEFNNKKYIIIKIYESSNKLIQSSNKVFYIRLNGQSIPCSRDYIRDIFLTNQLKNQKKENVIFEINHLLNLLNKMGDIEGSPILPPFYQLRLDELHQAISEYHGFFKLDPKEVLKDLNYLIADIKKEEKLYQLALDIELRKRWGSSWADFQGFLNYDKNKEFFKSTNTKLQSNLIVIKKILEKIKTMM